MNQFKVNDVVRVLKEDEFGVNAHAIVKATYEDGKVWIANLNSPYCGTISDIVCPSEIELIKKP